MARTSKLSEKRKELELELLREEAARVRKLANMLHYMLGFAHIGRDEHPFTIIAEHTAAEAAPHLVRHLNRRLAERELKGKLRRQVKGQIKKKITKAIKKKLRKKVQQ